MSDDAVVLSVGGQRFHTRASTLARYPGTLLGAMFAPHNRDLLQANAAGEYCFDRNPRAFAVILDFYRTGKLDVQRPFAAASSTAAEETAPIGLAELRDELDYFQLPEHMWTPAVLASLHTTAAARISTFVDVLLDLCRVHLDHFIDIVVVHFARGEDHDSASLRNVNRGVEQVCQPLLSQCGDIGFRILSDEKLCAVVRDVAKRRYPLLRMSVQMVRHELLVLCLSGYLDVELIRENLNLPAVAATAAATGVVQTTAPRTASTRPQPSS